MPAPHEPLEHQALLRSVGKLALGQVQRDDDDDDDDDANDADNEPDHNEAAAEVERLARWVNDWPVYKHNPLNNLARRVVKYFGTTTTAQELLADRQARQTEKGLTQRYMLDADRILAGNYLREAKKCDNEMLKKLRDMQDTESRHISLPRFLTAKQMGKCTDLMRHREVVLWPDEADEEARKMPMHSNAPYHDMYTIRTREFLWQRLRVEQRDASMSCFILGLLCVFCEIVGIIILGLAASEAAEAVNILNANGIVAACVIIISSLVAGLGAVTYTETLLRMGMTGALWTLSLLTPLLFSTAFDLDQKHEGCTPSQRDYSPGNGCESLLGKSTAFVVFVSIAILLCFCQAYSCSLLVDSINDTTRLTDSLLLLRYFNSRHGVLRSKFDAKEMSKSTSGEVRFCTPWFGEGGVFGTYNNMSPAYASSAGLSRESTKLEGRPSGDPIVGW